MEQIDSRLKPGTASLDYVIEYPRFKAISDMIVMCLDRTTESGESHCMVLEGGTGAGKTTLVRKFAASFAPNREETGNVVPVLYVETPSPVTVKGMAGAMLEALKDPHPFRGSTATVNSRLARLILGCRVELVILDDIQHLIDGTGRVSEVGDWLKVLIKNTGVPFLIVGLETKVMPILKSNAQLRRLFSSSCVLEAFQIADPEGRKEYGRFISLVLKKYSVELDASIPLTELVTRVHYVTDGYAGQTINFIRDCQYFARKRGEKEGKGNPGEDGLDVVVDLAILKKEFSSRFASSGKENPFARDFSTPFTPPEPLIIDTLGEQQTPSNRRRRGRPPVVDALRPG